MLKLCIRQGLDTVGNTDCHHQLNIGEKEDNKIYPHCSQPYLKSCLVHNCLMQVNDIVNLQSRAKTSVLGLCFTPVTRTRTRRTRRTTTPKYTRRKHPRGLKLGKNLTKPNQTHATHLLTLTLLSPPRH